MKKKSKKQEKIIINIANTQYEIIKDVASMLKWSVSSDPDGKWDLLWTDSAVSSERLSKMRITQKINHFPGMYQLARKNCMALNLNKLRKLFPNDKFNIFIISKRLQFLPSNLGPADRTNGFHECLE